MVSGLGYQIVLVIFTEYISCRLHGDFINLHVTTYISQTLLSSSLNLQVGFYRVPKWVHKEH